MNGTRTYLDYNASAPLRPEARAAVVAALDVAGNPSSVHAEGRAARALVETAREEIARLIGAKPSEIVFTSGATEASNWVLHRSWRTIYTADIEHAAVRAPCLASEGRLVRLPVRADGVIDAAAFASAVAECPHADRAGHSLLVVQAANNETGVLQPVAEMAATARAHGLAVFSDAVQAVGRIALDVSALGVDYLSLSAHKIGGPKGIGALVLRDGAQTVAPLPPFVIGGGQERRRRGGTENVAAIAGFGAAASAAARDLADMVRLARLRDRLEREALRIAPDAVVIGAGASRLPNTASFALRGVSADRLVIALDLDGIAISAGSACASGKVGASHVLAAMGLAPELSSSAIRISLGHATTDADIDAFLAAFARHAARQAATTQNETKLTADAAPQARARSTTSAGER
ncbi:MAG: cysteine desulfurase family protein [Hyphomicrobium sp.]